MARTWRRVDGVLPLDKPVGMSSNAALQAVRRMFGAEKAGHAGTLDPLASGLLPVLFGQATRFSGWLLDTDKAYRASVRLGVTTETADAEGKVRETRPVEVAIAQIDDALAKFRGAIEQVPPMYSALKRAGRPLYELARQGLTVERAARPVRIERLDLLEFSGTLLEIEVVCSKGTYIRTLAEDIGRVLGCGAHLAGLQRIAAGNFTIEQAAALDRLAGMDDEGRTGWLRPVDELLTQLPGIELDLSESRCFSQGQGVGRAVADGQDYRVYAPAGVFLGVGGGQTGGRLQPRRLIAGHAG
jgi:tRNA pseudouridine55 synthase